MISDPTDWHLALAHVSGQLVHGQERISTVELFAKLGVPVTDGACRRLKRLMLGLGWHGPKLMRWGKKTLKGYWRHPSLPVIVRQEPVVEVATVEGETLAPELEAVVRLGLRKIAQILALPTDAGNGNILRAQVGAAGIAVGAQLKADQSRMKQAQRRDVLAQIIALVAEEQKAMAERREREKGEGSTNRDSE
jgi:hypothetical protein